MAKKSITPKITTPAPKTASSSKTYLVYPNAKKPADTIEINKAGDAYKSFQAKGIGDAKANLTASIKGSSPSKDKAGNTYLKVNNKTTQYGENSREYPTAFNPVEKLRSKASDIGGNAKSGSVKAVSKDFGSNSKTTVSKAVNDNKNVKTASVAINKKIKGKS